jgi:hypothetical protein
VRAIIIVWLVIAAAVAVTALDAASIAFTKFRLADVASAASTLAANAYRSNPDAAAACQVAVTSITTEDAAAKLTKNGCTVDAQTGLVTITVRKEAKTILAGRLGFTKHFAKVSATETNGPPAL